MPSQAQLDANRRNAQKSTGPVTPEGKAAASRNALKSGIYAGSHVIAGEDPAELEALTDALRLHNAPADPNQSVLVDVLISAEWTLRRLRRIEAQLWSYCLEDLDNQLSREDYLNDQIRHNSPLGHIYYDHAETFALLHRRIESTQRTYLRTLQALQDLQKAAAVRPPEPAQSAALPPAPVSQPKSPVQSQPLASPIGFVPQTAPRCQELPRISPQRRLTPPQAPHKPRCTIEEA